MLVVPLPCCARLEEAGKMPPQQRQRPLAVSTASAARLLVYSSSELNFRFRKIQFKNFAYAFLKNGKPPQSRGRKQVKPATRQEQPLHSFSAFPPKALNI